MTSEKSAYSRRSIVASLAGAVPVAAIPFPVKAFAELESDDPAFAAIEAHRRAWARLGEVLRAQDRLEETIPKERRRSSITAFEEKIFEDDDPRWIEAEKTEWQAHDDLADAEDQFVLNQPTTILGVAALLRHVAEHYVETGDDLCDSRSEFNSEGGDTFDFREAFGLALADSLERIISGQPIERGRFKRCEYGEADDDEPDEKEAVVQEPPKESTPEDRIAGYRRVIDLCTNWINEAEAEIAAGAQAAV